MDKQKERKPRVVSYGEYIHYLARKSALTTESVLMILMAGLSGLLAVLAGITTPCALLGEAGGLIVLPILLLLSIGAGWGALVLYRTGMEAANASSDMEPVVPRTRSRVEELPAEETLVRASLKPIPAIKSELLRAADHAKDSPPEQLLRPHLSGSLDSGEKENGQTQENRFL